MKTCRVRALANLANFPSQTESVLVKATSSSGADTIQEEPLTFRPICGRFASVFDTFMFHCVVKKVIMQPASIGTSKPARWCQGWFVALLALLRQLTAAVRRHGIESWAPEAGQL